MPPLTNEEIHKKLEAIALPLLQKANVDLIELKVKRAGRDVHIEFTADKPEGRITLEACAKLNRAIIDAVDSEGFLGEDYELEFSSPGLDRPLMTQKDFARNLNYDVQVFLKEKIDGKKEYTGKLIAVDQDTLKVGLKKKVTIVLPMAQVERGLLVI